MITTRPSIARTISGCRSGYTLIELTIATGISGILLSGMMSSVFIALKASDSTSGAPAVTRNAHQVVAQMTAELQFAESIPASGTNSITVTVPDQNGDTIAETITWSWSGTIGDPLTRQFNGGTTVNMIDSIELFTPVPMPTTGPADFVLIELRVTSDSNTTIQAAAPLPNTP